MSGLHDGNSAIPIPTPSCDGLVEIPEAAHLREQLCASPVLPTSPSPLEQHILHGLACTVGSALGSSPPSVEQCLTAFTLSNSANLSAGARAWTKHAHRSGTIPATAKIIRTKEAEAEALLSSFGWWGRPKGPVDVINAQALELFWKVVRNATWKNLHWLPHQVLVYEARVQEGYGMRWSQNRSFHEGSNDRDAVDARPWQFRGFVEPMMEDGHERGWRH